ncbi:hypothetical protein [Prosthecochloris sp. HL-130-GSB]|uniref:hypothetical protein n=1 Tax=Prosthecochloris sp. HL-130-GSB TaxID=1974213 RepID=UPI000A1C17AB|nr:hypothetical protein [Prosthecochloris sp. HL-130-GSB]ARM30715.1 hypothetical protein B9H02_04555 [Prosthecochloris sp. HL-130-GSB]MBO8093508.1 hypothetical protein [Prosthecochloris sp.]
MKKLLSITILGLLLLQGCASTLQLDPQAYDGQEMIYQEGVEAIMSQKKALVAIRPEAITYSSEDRPTIVITVQNGTMKPFDFSTENVQVFVDGEPHKVFTYDELVSEVKRKQTWSAIAAALSGVARSMNAANAGYTYNSGTLNAYTYDNSGNGINGFGSYSGYTYNAAAAQQAQAAANAQTQAEMQAIVNSTEQSLDALSATMLKKTTVLPQALHGGYVTIEKIPIADHPRDIKVVIMAAGEEHEFLFKHFKAQK